MRPLFATGALGIEKPLEKLMGGHLDADGLRQQGVQWLRLRTQGRVRPASRGSRQYRVLRVEMSSGHLRQTGVDVDRSVLDTARRQQLQATPHLAEWHRRTHTVGVLALVVGLVTQDQLLGVARMHGDHVGILEDLHVPGQTADLHVLADETERHAELPALETDEAVNSDRPTHDDVERLRQCLGQGVVSVVEKAGITRQVTDVSDRPLPGKAIKDPHPGPRFRGQSSTDRISRSARETRLSKRAKTYQQWIEAEPIAELR